MSRFIYDRIYILLPGQQVPQVAIDEAVKLANADAQIAITQEPSLLEVYRSKEGSFFNCGLIPYNPANELVARFGVAWFVDGKDRRHVRVASDIKKVKLHQSSCLWPRHLQSYNLVYPSMTIGCGGHMLIKCKCGKEGRFDDMGWDGNKCWLCHEKEQYEQETGFQLVR